MARLPVYVRTLLGLADDKIATISSERLAELAGVNAAQVRKDLSYLGSYGTRGVGYDVEYLLFQMSRELGLTPDWPVISAGVGGGHLGGHHLGQHVAQLGRDHVHQRLALEQTGHLVGGDAPAPHHEAGAARHPEVHRGERLVDGHGPGLTGRRRRAWRTGPSDAAGRSSESAARRPGRPCAGTCRRGR